MPKDWPTRSEEMSPDADAFDTSLAANIMRLPRHEVDQYEAFVQLKEAGRSVADIASSYGTSVFVVTQRLALGGLSPGLRQAWREEKIDADDAKAFTVVQDHALQDQAYTSLAHGQMLHWPSIVRALTHSDSAAAVELRFVGQEVYVGAGGRPQRDLCEEEMHVLDPAILKRLAREKVEATARDMVAKGWEWAYLRTELPNDRYRWGTVRVEIRHTEKELFRIEELKPAMEAALRQHRAGQGPPRVRRHRPGSPAALHHGRAEGRSRLRPDHHTRRHTADRAQLCPPRLRPGRDAPGRRGAGGRG